VRGGARASSIDAIATGHHADDALETLLQRWTRGTDRCSASGTGARVVVDPAIDARHVDGADAVDRRCSERPITIVRPLLWLRREEVRRTLSELAIPWREDTSNASARFTRNRVRHALLPRIASITGAIENLRAFGAAVEELEEHCARLTAHLVWSPPVHAIARRGAHEIDLGGSIARARLMELRPRPLLRRALWRLLTEGSGESPSRALLDRIADDLVNGRCAHHSLPADGRCSCVRICCCSSRRAACATVPRAIRDSSSFSKRAHACRRRSRSTARSRSPTGARSRPSSCATMRATCRADLSASSSMHPTSTDRSPCVGRCPAIGSTGSARRARKCSRDSCPTRACRARIERACRSSSTGPQIVWVAGIRPCEGRRVSPATTRRVRLTLHHPAAADEERSDSRAARQPGLYEQALPSR
jgi:hypothetical protein